MSATATGWVFAGVRSLHTRLVSARRADVLVEALVPLLAGSRRIVDVGCGDGRLAARVQARLPGVFVAGADVLARAPAPVPLVRYDGRRLPYASGSFDTAMLVDVLHHAEDPAALLREAARVSRVLVVKDHLRRGPWSAAMLAFMDWVGNRPYGVGLEYGYLGLPAWRALFERLSLEVERFQEGIDLYPRPFNVVFRPDWQFVARLRVPAPIGRAAC